MRVLLGTRAPYPAVAVVAGPVVPLEGVQHQSLVRGVVERGATARPPWGDLVARCDDAWATSGSPASCAARRLRPSGRGRGTTWSSARRLRGRRGGRVEKGPR